MKQYLSASPTDEGWQKARMRCLVRDNFTCQAHKLGLSDCQENRLRFLQVHHIQMRVHGGTHDLDNLLTLCKAHHMEIHPHMRFELKQTVKEFEMNNKEL